MEIDIFRNIQFILEQRKFQHSRDEKCHLVVCSCPAQQRGAAGSSGDRRLWAVTCTLRRRIAGVSFACPASIRVSNPGRVVVHLTKDRSTAISRTSDLQRGSSENT